MAFLTDTFTDTASTQVASHTSDSGHTWTNNGAFSGVPTIASGTAVLGQTSGATCGMYSSATPPSADYCVVAVVKCVTSVAGDLIAATARGSTSAKSFYEARYLVGTGWQLNRVVAGTRTQIGSTYSGVTLSAGQSATMTLIVSGSNVGLLVNGTLVASGDDTTYTTAGTVGFEITSGSSPNSGTSIQLDTLTASTVGSFVKPSITYTVLGAGQETHSIQAFIPVDYVAGTAKPTILVLGGTGQRGTDNTAQMTDGLALQVIAQALTWPAITIFVQFPSTGSTGGREWGFPAIAASQSAVEALYTCDPTRRYLTGFSLGALMALEYLYSSSTFWAAVLVAEGYCSNRVYLLSGESSSITSAQAAAEVAALNRTMPIRQFQSLADANNVPANAQETRDAFVAAGATGYAYSEGAPVTGLDHVSAYNAVYADATQFTWLYTNRRALSGGGSNSSPVLTVPHVIALRTRLKHAEHRRHRRR